MGKAMAKCAARIFRQERGYNESVPVICTGEVNSVHLTFIGDVDEELEGEEMGTLEGESMRENLYIEETEGHRMRAALSTMHKKTMRWTRRKWRIEGMAASRGGIRKASLHLVYILMPGRWRA